MDVNVAMSAMQALESLWRNAGLLPEPLASIELPVRGAVLPSSFNVTTAAQASLGAAALAAVQIGRARGRPSQQVRVDAEHAVLDSLVWFTVEGRMTNGWDPLSGLYRTADGWVCVNANFAHHRDGVLRLLDLPVGPHTERGAIET